ncbi:MAG: alpha/beta fold hydrolase [Clostridia bacterium]|nr:alpha/beta fold hydrolase [Clostridia bacterium]
MIPIDMPTLIVILSMLIIIPIVLLFLTMYFIYRFSFGRKKDADVYDGFDTPHMEPYKEESHAAISTLLSIEYEEIYIESPLDGTRLHARLKLMDDKSPIQILFHGYRSNPFRDFSGGALAALSHGHSVLMIDQRAHLGSEGKTITFGIKERYDALGWINYIHDRFPEREIILVGISMGAATVIGAAGLELPDAVKCAIADCPFAVVKDELSHAAKNMGIFANIYPVIRFSGKIFGKFDTEDGDLRKSVAASRIPIMILHGDADRLVPIEMSLQLKEAAPDTVTHVAFPGARHGISYLTDKERYIKEVYGFIAKHTTASAAE